jgi:hypothetical protein
MASWERNLIGWLAGWLVGLVEFVRTRKRSFTETCKDQVHIPACRVSIKLTRSKSIQIDWRYARSIGGQFG